MNCEWLSTYTKTGKPSKINELGTYYACPCIKQCIFYSIIFKDTIQVHFSEGDGFNQFKGSPGRLRNHEKEQLQKY